MKIVKKEAEYLNKTALVKKAHIDMEISIRIDIQKYNLNYFSHFYSIISSPYLNSLQGLRISIDANPNFKA